MLVMCLECVLLGERVAESVEYNRVLKVVLGVSSPKTSDLVMVRVRHR